jgi:hypothetical protein
MLRIDTISVLLALNDTTHVIYSLCYFGFFNQHLWSCLVGLRMLTRSLWRIMWRPHFMTRLKSKWWSDASIWSKVINIYLAGVSMANNYRRFASADFASVSTDRNALASAFKAKKDTLKMKVLFSHWKKNHLYNYGLKGNDVVQPRVISHLY